MWCLMLIDNHEIIKFNIFFCKCIQFVIKAYTFFYLYDIVVNIENLNEKKYFN